MKNRKTFCVGIEEGKVVQGNVKEKVKKGYSEALVSVSARDRELYTSSILLLLIKSMHIVRIAHSK